MHARGYAAAGGWKVDAVADLIPQRRNGFIKEFSAAREFSEVGDLLKDPTIDAVSICLPNHLHAPVALLALKAGKHVLCEKPPALNAADARKIERSAAKAGKVLLYSLQRRFGGNEQASHQAITKGHAGAVYHARASWTRTRGTPIGTGWFSDKSKSGGGAIIDLGVHMLDLAWYLLGEPEPATVMAVAHKRIGKAVEQATDVEESGFALFRFANGASLELAASWALNQPPQQNGTLCRIHGEAGAVDVYVPGGPVLYRAFSEKGEPKETVLKLPKTVGHAAMIRHFRDCILNQVSPLCGAQQGTALMKMIDSFYKSAATGKSVQI